MSNISFKKEEIIPCKDYCAEKKKELASAISGYKVRPCLVVIQIGDNKASDSYIKGKKKDCDEVGIDLLHHKICEDKYTQEKLCRLITELNNDECIHGIIIQLPIPTKYNLQELVSCIYPQKDVDGFRKDAIHIPCTPKGIIDWLKFNQYDFEGKNVTVLGRSNLVGRPLTNLLINEGATVTCCNSHTVCREKYTLNSELIISAVGKSKFISKEIPHNAIVVDVGINHDDNGILCGDVDREYVEANIKDTYVTPVPGGVGLLTRLALLQNTLDAFKMLNCR